MSAIITAPFINNFPLGDSNKTDWKGLEQYLNSLFGEDDKERAYALREVGNIFPNHIPIEASKDDMPSYLPRVKDAVAVKYKDMEIWQYRGIMTKEEREILHKEVIGEISDAPFYVMEQAVHGNYYNGTAWANWETKRPKYYSGSWLDIKWAKYYNGTSWITFYSLVPDNLGILRTASTTTTGYTDISSTGQNMYGKWLHAYNSYSTGVGADSHSHTSNSIISSASAYSVSINSNLVIYERTGTPNHFHGSVSHTCTTAAAYPAYAAFYGYECTVQGQTHIPLNTVLFWTGTTANVPTGWTYRSTNNGRYLRALSGQTGGNTVATYNSHSMTAVTNGSASTGANLAAVGSTARGYYNVSHTHSIPVHTHANSYTPAYFSTILMLNSADRGEVPLNAASWFTAAPVAHGGQAWTLQTTTYSRLMYASTTWGSTGGTTTHTHAHTGNTNLTDVGAATPNNTPSSLAVLSAGSHHHPISSTPAHTAKSNFPADRRVLIYKRTT